MAISEYNKVSFITSSSTKIPKMLNRTGSLIVLSSNLSNNHKRTSLWLRGNLIASGWGLEKEENMNNAEWIAMSYNPIFSQTFGMSYFSPEEDVVETIDNPRSVEMWLKHNHNYTDTCYNNLYTYASEQFTKINKDINGIKVDIENIDVKLNKYKEDTYTYVATAKENCYTYTKYWVDRIIGGAPDFLDSLDEIKNFLKNDRENHMATLTKIQNIDKYSVKREDEITDGGKLYTYITKNSTYEYVDKSKTYEGTYEYITYDDSGNPVEKKGTYTYYGTSTYKGGQISLNSFQVCTGEKWGNTPLDQLLNLLVEPYPYKKPTLDSIVINGIPLSDWTNDVIEYNSKVNLDTIGLDISLNDASSTTLIFENSILKNTASLSNGLNNVTGLLNSISTISKNPTTKSEALDLINKEFILNSNMKYQFSHGKANVNLYPQLKSLNIQDTDHAFVEGLTEKTDFPKIGKKFSFKVFWGITDQSAPVTANGLSGQSNKLIDSKKSTGQLKITNLLGQYIIWIALPGALFDNSRVIMKSWNSGIENDITEINSVMLKKHISDKYVYNGTQYKTFYLENVEYTMFADTMTLEVNF